MIEAGETVEIVWELFWFENQKDFERKLLEKEDFLYVHAKNFTFLPGEEMVFEVDVCKDIEEEDICIECERQRASCQLQKSEKDTTIKKTLPVHCKKAAVFKYRESFKRCLSDL